MRPTGCTAVRKGLQRLEKRCLIEGFEAENQHRADGKAEKVYAAITVRLWTQQSNSRTFRRLFQKPRGEISMKVCPIWKNPLPHWDLQMGQLMGQPHLSHWKPGIQLTSFIRVQTESQRCT
jgi:hypothetical protein